MKVIYENLTAAYHALQNRETGAAKADHRLLGGKIALADRLAKQSIPMVETTWVSHGDWGVMEAALKRHPKLFCKQRSGNQGESAFAVWRNESGIQGLTHDGMALSDEAVVRKV